MNLKTPIIFFFSIIGYIKMAIAQSLPWKEANIKEVTEAYQKANSMFVNTPSYFFRLKYNSYKSYTSKDPLESSKGYYKRINGNYLTEAMGVKTIQNASLKIMIDTADQVVTVMNPGNLSPTIPSAEEINAMLSGVKALRKINNGKSFRYRIEFNKNDRYDAYEFSVSEKGWLEALIYYYSEQSYKEYDNDQSDKTIELKMKPRLEINFYDYKTSAVSAEQEFSADKVVSAELGKLHLTEKYKTFKLIDYRTTSKK